MATYIAKQDIFICSEGRYIRAGETFTCAEKPGDAWDPQDDEANAAVAALNASTDGTTAKSGKSAS